MSGLLDAKRLLVEMQRLYPPGDNHKLVVGKGNNLEVHILYREIWQPLIATDDDWGKSLDEVVLDIKKALLESQGWNAVDNLD